MSTGELPALEVVIPAKAGSHTATARAADKWIPAFAGIYCFSVTGAFASFAYPLRSLR